VLEQQMKKFKFWAVAAFLRNKKEQLFSCSCLNKLRLIIVLKTGSLMIN